VIVKVDATDTYYLLDWPERAERLAELLRTWVSDRMELVPTEYKPELGATEARSDFVCYLMETGQMMYPVPKGAQFDRALAAALPHHPIVRGGRGNGQYLGIRRRRNTGSSAEGK
jgi:hypothetical protein